MRAKSWVPEDEHPEGLFERDDDPFEIAARAFETQVIPISEFYNDPVGFVDEFINFGKPAKGTTPNLTVYQREIMAELPVSKRLAVRSPHGAGKTAAKALLILWFGITRDHAGVDWKCATTAGAWRQLEKYLWPEIHKWARRLNWTKLGIEPWRDGKELMTLSLSLEHGEAFAVASSDKMKIEGVHADSVLYIFDEGKSIAADIFDAAEGAFSGAQVADDGTPHDDETRALEALAMASSTPGDTSGRFYEIHMRKPGFEDWTVRHVTCKEVMAAGRISEHWRAQREKQWGADSALYANRVLGQFHSSSSDTTIPLAWAEAAVERWHEWVRAGRRKHAQSRVLGVDVALSGKDFTAIATRRGDVVEKIEKLALAETTAVSAAVTVRLEAGDLVIVDAIGVGAGVLAELRQAGRNVRPFTASGKSFRKDISGQSGFLNRRSEMWWGMRERLDPAFGSTVCLPPDDELLAELVSPRWSVTAGGKIQVETKDSVKDRLGRSTDVADAVLQTFTGPESQFEISKTPAVAQPYGGSNDVSRFMESMGQTEGTYRFGEGESDMFHSWETEM